MVSFRHDEAGTPEAFWLERFAGLSLPPVRLVSGSRVVVLAAHPDDETLGAGGLIAAAAETGCAVSVVVATDGESSHPHSMTWTPERLSAVRRRELTDAVTRLAPRAAITFLGLPDGHVAAHIPELADAVADRTPALIVAPWRRDAHSDHDAAGQAASIAAARTGAALLEYPVWFWHWGGADVDALPWPDLVRLDLSESHQRAKRDAMADHRTQVTALSPARGDEVLLDEHVLIHFRRSFETFVHTAAPAGGNGPMTATVATVGALSEGQRRDAAHLLGALVTDGAALGWTDPPTEDEVAELFAAVSAQVPIGDAALAVAVENDELIGLGYWRRYERPTHRPHADLEKIAVAASHHGKGLGRRLMRSLIEAARASMIEQLTLDLRADNTAAIALYESLGFRRYGELADFVAVGDRRYDKLFYVLDLRSD